MKFCRQRLPCLPLQRRISQSLWHLFALAALSQAWPAWSADAPMPSAAASAELREPRFPIYEYLVDGASLLPAAVIERVVNPFMGEQRSVADVERARAALEKAYQEAGYLTVLVTIPEQKVDEGSVTLLVTEAPLQKSSVKGAEYTLPSELKARVPELAENKVPNFNKVQEQLAALNASGNLRVTPVLRAGSLPGTVDLQLDVEDRSPLTATIDVNNRQSPNTTASRMGANLRYENLWQLGHSLALGIQTAPQRIDDAQVLSGTYVFPYGASGNTATVYLVSSRSRFETLAGAPGLGLQGNSDTLGLRVNARLGTGDGYLYVGSLGVDYKDLRQALFANVPGGQSTLSDTPVRYMPMVANVNASFFNEGRRLILDGTLSVGLGGLLGDGDARFNARRSGAPASFLALRGNLNYLHNLDRWTVAGKATAQVAAQPLLSPEQMIVGGADTVRGYYEGERAGDYGLSGSIELRSPVVSLSGLKLSSAVTSSRIGAIAFVDAGTVATLKTSAGWARHSLAGAGIGLRWSGPSGFSLDADIAHAFVAGSVTPAGESRVHARGLWVF